MSAPEPGRVIYALDRDRAYHFVTVVLLVLAVVLSWLAVSFTPDAATAEVGSRHLHRPMQVAFMLMGGSPLIAWLWWMRRYMRRMVWHPTEAIVAIERCGYFGKKTWRLPVTAFGGFTAHEGHSDIPGTPTVRAPYRRLRVRGLPPLILDDQGTVHDRRALDAILAGRPPNPARPPKRPQ